QILGPLTVCTIQLDSRKLCAQALPLFSGAQMKPTGKPRVKPSAWNKLRRGDGIGCLQFTPEYSKNDSTCLPDRGNLSSDVMPHIPAPHPEDHVLRNVGRMVGNAFQVSCHQ